MRITFLLLTLCLASRAFAIDFNREIMPILSEKCFNCHGPDGEERKAGLRLDQEAGAKAALKTGAIAVVPGKRGESALWQRISGADPEEQMPPKEFPKQLTEAERELLGQWIDAGAVWEAHWAFVPPKQEPLPALQDTAWVRGPIDQFVLARLEAAGLHPSAEADRRTQIRRLTYDLHGLPPTPEDVDAFIADPRPDAYEQLVDRLLASPRYGERWARHWLDVVHYGDTHGYDKDKRRPNAWPYRDYVINMLNADLPYGQFVRQQVAGDVLEAENPQAVVATGFIAAGPWDLVGHAELREGTKDKNITRNLDRDDMVMNTMSTFVSMTVHCARCHDHKFDPIAQKEYYGLQAVFAGVDRANRPYDPDPALHARRTGLTREQTQLQARAKEIEAQLASVTSPEIATLELRLQEQKAALEVLQREAGSSPSNGYHSEVSMEAETTKWVQLDLGQPVQIEEIALIAARPVDFLDTPGFGFPSRFRIDVSNDPSFGARLNIFDSTGSGSRNPKERRAVFAAAGIEARYVLVTATQLWQRTNDYVFALGEVQVMSGGKNAAIGAAVSASDALEVGLWAKKYLTDGYSSRERLDVPPEVLAKTEQVRAAVAEDEATLLSLRETALAPEVKQERITIVARLGMVEGEIETLREPQWTYAAATDFRSEGSFVAARGPRPVYLLARGDVEQPLEQATPAGLACVPGVEARFALADPQDEGARRAALAAWITDPANTLTWRSIVNRVWHHHFGRGIVETPNDFGHLGAQPTHPELLDWLALAFQEHGQSLKWLHREIVTSATYRQASVHNEKAAALDGSNQLLWRMNRQQVDAESLRDAILMVSGKLDLTMGGPGFDLFTFEDDHSPRYKYEEHDPDDPKALRRTVYRFIVRSAPDPLMDTLDCADPSQNVPVRNTTLTALQALALLNNKLVVRQAEHLAARAAGMAPTLNEQVAAAFRLALVRGLRAEELAALVGYAEKHGLAAACRVILNSNEFMFVD